MRRLWSIFVGVLCLASAWQAEAVSVNLAWDYTQGGVPAVNFNVYKQVGCAGAFTNIASVPVTTKTYSDTAVTEGQTYCWDVTAQAATGKESTPSNVLQFQVPLSTPVSPANLRGTLGP